MVYWITGNSGSGKSTLAHTLKDQIPNSIIISGDQFRKVWKVEHYDYDTIAKIAILLEAHGHTVIIDCIGPIASEVARIKKMFNKCVEIHLPFGRDAKGRKIG
jgi:adenylylsulfate kinase-like enzyme